MRLWAWGILGGLVLSVVGGLAWRAWRLERQLLRERVTAANAMAAMDSSRLAVRRDGDSAVAVATRLAFQREVRLRAAFRDSAQEVGKVVARLRLEGDSLRRVDSARAVEVRGDTLRAAGELDALDSLGVRARALVVLVAPYREAVWDWTLSRAPVALELGLSCRGPLAVARLAGPPWAPLKLDSVAQAPEVCNPPPRRPAWAPLSLRPPGVLPMALLFFAGAWVESRVGLLGAGPRP